MTTSTEIAERFTAHFESEVVDGNLRLYSPEEWDMAPVDGPNKRFGWVEPTLEPGTDEYVAHMCPEIIAAHLTQTTVVDHHYLDCVHYLCNAALVIQVKTGKPHDEAVRLAESMLYDIAPGSTALMSQVQAAALEGP